MGFSGNTLNPFSTPMLRIRIFSGKSLCRSQVAQQQDAQHRQGNVFPAGKFPHQAEGLPHLVLNGFDGEIQFAGDLGIGKAGQAAELKDGQALRRKQAKSFLYQLPVIHRGGRGGTSIRLRSQQLFRISGRAGSLLAQQRDTGVFRGGVEVKLHSFIVYHIRVMLPYADKHILYGILGILPVFNEREGIVGQGAIMLPEKFFKTLI